MNHPFIAGNAASQARANASSGEVRPASVLLTVALSQGTRSPSSLDDPQFLDERRRVREELEHLPAGDVSDTLADRYQMLNEEFLRRARIAWSPTSWEAAQ